MPVGSNMPPHRAREIVSLRRLIPCRTALSCICIMVPATCAVLALSPPDSAGANRSVEPSQLSLDKFDLTFDDEFDDLNISARSPNSRWSAHTPWNGDFGDAVF